MAAAIIVHNNKILTTQRGYGELKGGWEFPGGKIEENETPENALIREIKEELDIEIDVRELLHTVEYDYPDFHLSMDCFICKIQSGNIVLKEHQNAKWLTRQELNSVDWLPADKKLLERIERWFAMDNTKLISFLIKAKKATYAGKGAETSSSRPESHDLIYREEDYMYYDTYLGGELFVGEEALWISEKPYWSMNYAGRVIEDPFSGDFLKEALLHVPVEMPFRGPEEYSNGDYTYQCQVSGNFEWFQGYETILFQGKIVYECYFHGSIIR